MLNKILKELKVLIGENQYKNYFEILQINESKNNEIILNAPNQFIAKHIQTKYQNILEKIAEKTNSKKYKITIQVNNEKINKPQETQPIVAKKQISILNQSLTFDNFIVGQSNEFAYRICKTITDENKFGKDFNPIFIYSNTGLGKTHLLHASGHECLELGKKVIYKTSKGFKKDYYNAILTNKFDSFNSEYKDCDLLLIDDIQFLGTTDKMQEEFFHIFNDIIERKGQIIITSDVAPKNLNGIEDRLKSRFNKGVLANISVPDIETKKAIIKKKSLVYDIELNDEMINTIANYIGENVRDLEGIINYIYAFQSIRKQKITLDDLKNQIKEYIKENQSNIEIEDIFDIVSSELNVKTSEIKSSSKKQEIVKAKRIVIFLTKELISNSVSQIATHFQMKDHSAISKHIKKINEMICLDDDFRSLVEHLKNKIINSKNKDY
ncbi:chromosomal replication initiator protein DnaA [Campylobacter sp. 2018MI01]|uniref:chromosomal replication initiator protein DnaA n=1 Tax=Campylobacter sp. 2018MI01 TaxID=2836735 RepID=UPI001BD95F30|nr:chromosomal replication initiator protein DnaA [Campylobacter sp. 2018MI01]MBT0878468.1 chromosomal replication initiator protein DnaA [Campylobacter sp. 2018MI01]